MLKKFFQEVLDDAIGSLDRTVGVIDNRSIIMACNVAEMVGKTGEKIEKDMINSSEIFLLGDFTYKPFGDESGSKFCVFVSGNDKYARNYARMLAVSLKNSAKYYYEKYDKGNFIKNIILDNILPGDIFIKARGLNFNSYTSRVCMLVRTVNKSQDVALDAIHRLFPDKNKDFVINVNDTDIALIKQVNKGIKAKDLENLAEAIIDTLFGEYHIKSAVGIGSVVVGIKSLVNSFKEAQVALDVSKVFDIEKQIVRYDDLGIARLIYQLPVTLCNLFLKEVIKKGSIDSLDQETLFTIHAFFDNNLNVSETARKLFVHRNTLVYRLEKIKKLTGLDVREFKDAITFKVTLMVKKYLASNTMEY